MKSTLARKEVLALDDSLRDKIIECIYMGKQELDVYDFSAGKLNKREALELYHDGTIQVCLYDGTIINVEIERILRVNLQTLHKEIHRNIKNIESCRKFLFNCINYSKGIFESYYSELIHSLVETGKETFFRTFRKDGIVGLRKFMIKVNPTNVSGYVSDSYGVVMRERTGTNVLEQRIALSDLLVDNLNIDTYSHGRVEVRYVKSGPTSVQLQMVWFRRNEKRCQ